MAIHPLNQLCTARLINRPLQKLVEFPFNFSVPVFQHLGLATSKLEMQAQLNFRRLTRKTGVYFIVLYFDANATTMRLKAIKLQ